VAAPAPTVIAPTTTPLTPTPPTTKPDPKVPLDTKDGDGGWALVNLLLTILTALLMIVALVTIRKHRRDEEIGGKLANGLRIFNVLAVIAAIVVFILTEDMTLPMHMTDNWTIWMAAIAIVEVVLTIVSAKKFEKTAEEN
jgi:uncharacterized membrane protein